MMIRVLAVTGATASGKTELAIKLAKKHNGEIISCDSVQIYKYFDIGSAKPSAEELSEAPHHLISVLEPDAPCNAGIWKDAAIDCVNDIVSRGKTPIIAGGTGLYLKALYLGMFEENSRDDSYREYLNKQAETEGLDALYQKLLAEDPDYAQKISPRDQMRIIRALEASQVTGIPFSRLHLKNTKPDWLWSFTDTYLPRETIYQNIKNRVYAMIEGGLIEETENLLSIYGAGVAPMTAIGYRHVSDYLLGKYDKQTMIDTLIRDTRRYAKRQETLFRGLIPAELMQNSDILLN